MKPNRLILKFLLLVSVFFVCSIAYTFEQIYQPSLFERDIFIFSPEIIPLLINSFLVISIFYFFYTQRNCSKIGTNKIKLFQEETINQNKNSPLYTDQLLIDYFPNILCIKDQNGRWIQANSEYLISLDMQYPDYIGKTDAYLALNSNSNSSVFQENTILTKKAWRLRKSVKSNMPITLKNGDTVQLEILTTPIFDKNNQPFRLLVTGEQVQQSHKTKNELALLTAIFSTSHLSFIILDEALKIASANNAFCSLFGFSLNEVNNQFLSYITYSKQDFCKSIQTYFQTNHYQLWSGEVECKKKNGEIILIKLEIKPILSKYETFDNYFVTLEDITLLKENEKRILRIAHYDHLTGLVNRAMFMDRLAQFLSAAQRHKLNAIIFFIDLDNFKIVNDTLGHDAGDEVIKQTATRL